LRQPGSDFDLAGFVDDATVERWRGTADEVEELATAGA
jgi:hypothetical protein